MNWVRRKSAIAKTTEFIQFTHNLKEGLLWDRYEQQLPLCAFTSNGLNCRKCFNGPCRINPFGDEPDKGVCGADRDQIVMENLFQTTLEGVLEVARSVSILNGTSSTLELPDITAELPAETRKRLSAAKLIPIRKDQIFEVQNSFFSHKGYLQRTLLDLTRLGLIHYGFLKNIKTLLDKLSLDGHPFDAEGINLMVVGHAPLDFLKSLRDQTVQFAKEKRINLFVQGSEAITAFHTLADHGTPEIALMMNLDALVIAPNAHLPSLEILAKRFDIPVILIDEMDSNNQISSQTIELALRHRQKASSIAPFQMKPATGLKRTENHIFNKGERIKEAIQKGEILGVAVVIGEANVKQTFFERTLTLMETCLNQRVLILLGGELSAQADLLNEEMIKRTKGNLNSQNSLFEIGTLPLLNYFGFLYEMPEVVSLLSYLTQGREFNNFPVVIAFPEFFRASTWTTAVSFLSMGFPVQIGSLLPFWGSPPLTEILLREWPKISGGILMASPSVADGKIQGQELLTFLQNRKRLG